jgi:GGDEF domain-containing protein
MLKSVLSLFKSILYKVLFNKPTFVLTSTYVDKTKDELYKLAFTDKLTGVYNRNMLEEFRNKYDNMDMYVSIIDINGLKQINDLEGHQAGDILIRDIADTLQLTSELVFRLGGDEFLVFSVSPIFHIFSEAAIGTTHKTANETIGFAMFEADILMYKDKQLKKLKQKLKNKRLG